MITILNLSPRNQGINDQICDALVEGMTTNRVVHRYIKSRDLKIGVCNNCRFCMREPGNGLGVCTMSDDMKFLISALLDSDGVIVSAPINCYDLPSILRVILERMSVFCYWNDEMYAPKVRDVGRTIRGVLITTSALPGLMVPLLTKARTTFRLFAKPIGMKRIKYYHLGFKGRRIDQTFNERDLKAVRKILNGFAADIHQQSLKG
jgi:multimeric flavodoxin WrbA